MTTMMKLMKMMSTDVMMRRKRSVAAVLVFCFMLASYHHENKLLPAGNDKGHVLQTPAAPCDENAAAIRGSTPNSWPGLRRRLC